MASRASSAAIRAAQRFAQIQAKKQPIALTEAAAGRIKTLLTQKGANAIRVGVRQRGCSGNTYVMDYANEPGSHDAQVSDKGVTVYINPQALLKVTGTVLDFEEDDLGSQFVFNNPNAKGECGCGESFYV